MQQEAHMKLVGVNMGLHKYWGKPRSSAETGRVEGCRHREFAVLILADLYSIPRATG